MIALNRAFCSPQIFEETMLDSSRLTEMFANVYRNFTLTESLRSHEFIEVCFLFHFSFEPSFHLDLGQFSAYISGKFRNYADDFHLCGDMPQKNVLST